MVDFFDESDKALFLLEIGKSINEADTPDDHKLFVKHRNKILPDLIKNKRAQSSARHQWRTGRWANMLGIKKWHSSPEGRRMHRKLGIFLALRGQERPSLLREDLVTIRKAMITESVFYRSIIQQAELEALILDLDEAIKNMC